MSNGESQKFKILQRLRRGIATNSELAAIALKYTSRITDLRKDGHDVVLVSLDKKTGVALYALRRSKRKATA